MSNISDEIRKFGVTKYGSMRGLAEAIDMLPQTLNAYLSGARTISPKFLNKLKKTGFCIDDLDKTKCVIGDFVKLDIEGAIELSGITVSRLSKLLHIEEKELQSWEEGTSSPSINQIAQLFNQIIALSLTRLDVFTITNNQKEQKKNVG